MQLLFLTENKKNYCTDHYQPLPKKILENIALLLPPLFFLQPTLTTAFLFVVF